MNYLTPHRQLSSLNTIWITCYPLWFCPNGKLVGSIKLPKFCELLSKTLHNGQQLGKQPQPIKTNLIKIQHVFAVERSSVNHQSVSPRPTFNHSTHKPSHKTVNSQRAQWSHQKYCSTFCLLIVRRKREVALGRWSERKFPGKSVPEITLSLLPSQLLMAFGLGPQSILHNEILQHWSATQLSIQGFIFTDTFSGTNSNVVIAFENCEYL